MITVNTVLSHESALEFWRAYGIAAADANKRPRKLALPKVPSKEGELQLAFDYLTQRPIQLMVSNSNARRSLPDIRFHVCGKAMPTGALLDTRHGLRVSSPEFCFLQMASHLALIELILLGYELCGAYRMTPDIEHAEKGFTNAQPVTSVNKLKDLLAKTEGMKGHKQALRAVRYILDNSASPRETALSMLLCLPYKLGGFGFNQPMLNYRIDMGKSRKSLASKSHYYCDLYWPAEKLAVEYDSDQFHTEMKQIDSDAKRRNSLGAQGITVITVTRQQMNIPLEFKKAAAIISHYLGKRIQYVDPGFTNAHQALRKVLFKGYERDNYADYEKW